MPIYEFKCPNCLSEREVILPMEERDTPVECLGCHSLMERRISLPRPAIFITTGRDKVLKTLNAEDGFRLPARPKDRPRMEAALARGLDPSKATRGKGF